MFQSLPCIHSIHGDKQSWTAEGWSRSDLSQGWAQSKYA